MGMIVPEVTPQPGPGVRVQPVATEASFGGGPGLDAQGQVTHQIAQQTGEIAGLEMVRANQAAIEGAQAKASKLATDILYDPETGALGAKGLDALRAQKDAMTRYQKGMNDISQTLHGELQVGPFNRWAQAHGAIVNQHLMTHVDQQLKEHDNHSFDALIDNLAASSALSHGNSDALQFNMNTAMDNTKAYAERQRLDKDGTDHLVANVKDAMYRSTVNGMLRFQNDDSAQKYYAENKSEISPKARLEIEDLLDKVPRQKQELAKKQQEESYKANMRQAMLDMFDGNLTLSEAQRRFRNDDLKKGDYLMLEGRLNKPDALLMRSMLLSDPETFNNIRETQLAGTASSGEIQRMIARGFADKKISPEDGKYLVSMNDENPPSPKDKYVEAQAKEVRDFGMKYFSETNVLGRPTNQEKTSQEAESLVQTFYNSVDQTKADVKGIDEIRDRVKKMAMQKRFPGLGNLESAPDVVIDNKGKVTRLLNPTQHSNLKAKYRVVKTGSDKSADDDDGE